MTGPSRLADRRTSRRALKHAERRRRRGGVRRGPVALQRAAQRVVAAVAAVRRGWGRLVAGNRPFAAVLVVAVVLGLLMLSGPAQRYLDGRARVEALAAKVDALEAENQRLERRVDDLNDPTNIELLAREQQGFIRPGEVPYTLVPPEVDRPRITEPRDLASPEPATWFARAWITVQGWFGAAG